MPDYNLGRATGEIRIGYDDTGARRAQADMAAMSAEAAALDASMGRVNNTFDEGRKVQISTAEDIVRARGEVESLRKTYQDLQKEYNAAYEKAKEYAQQAKELSQEEVRDTNRIREARNAANKALDDAERIQRRASEAQESYRSKQEAVRLEIEKFNAAHQSAANGFKNIGREAEKAGEIIESLNDKLSGLARILGQAGIFGLFGGAAGGALGVLVSGGLQTLATAMSAVVEIAQSFVGAIALIPAVASAAGLALGTLVVGFHGIGQALSSIGDPKKFMESIKDLSPLAREAMLTIQSFTEAFRGARDQIQDSLFAPIIADIQPLIQTWLPALMNAGKQIGNEFGQSMHQVFAFMQQPAQMASFKTFTDNLVTGFSAARGAIQPFLAAWTTLATVGSGVFERLGTAITTIANEFNAWIQRTASSGQLLDFMNKALDGFTNMGRIVRDLAIGINNVFGIFQGQNGSALQTIARMSAEFRSWSKSTEGMGQISSFFTLIKAAAASLRPELTLIGQSLAIVGRTLTVLGIAIGPGLVSFFTSFRDSLAGLAPFVVQLAPAINQFLIAFGTTFQQIITTLGPRLPQFFNDMSDSFIQIMQILPPVVEVFAKFLDHLTPTEVEVLIGMVGALKLLSGTIPLVKGAMVALNAVMEIGPVGWTVAVIGALVIAGVALYENWDTVKAKFGELTSTFGGMSGIIDTIKRAWADLTAEVAKLWHEITSGTSGGWDIVLNSLSNLVDNISGYFTGLASSAYDWGKNMIQQFINGIGSMFNGVGTVMNSVIQAVKDPIPQSPAKTGPLAGISPDDMGSHFVTQFAEGMSSATPAVTAAASGVAGQAGAIGGGGRSVSQGFSSAGVSGSTTRDFSQGQSGFDQQVSFITKDLTAWKSIFEDSFNLVNSIAGIVTSTIRVAADLINGGDNALTRPGGLFGPPAGANQRNVTGIDGKPIRGQAPDQWGKDLANASGLNGQQVVPGVPNKHIAAPNSWSTNPPVTDPATPAAGAAAVSGQAGTGQFSAGASPTPPATPPASTVGAAQPNASGPLPGDTPLGTALKAKGYSDKQVRLIQGFSQREGPNPAGNPTLGWTDDQLGGDASLQGHVNALDKQFKDRIGQVGPRGNVIGQFPENGSDSDQANWIADVVGQNGSTSDWQHNAQPTRENYVNSIVAGMPALPQQTNTAGAVSGAPSSPVDASKLPEGMGNPKGLHPNTELANKAVTAVFGDRIKAVGGSIGGNRSNDSGSGEHQGGALDIILGQLGQNPTPEAQALGNEIQSFLQQNQEAFGTQWSIWQGQFNPAGGASRPYGDHGGITENHFDHIHGFFGDPNVENTPDSQGTGMFNLPPGYSGPLAPIPPVDGTTAQGVLSQIPGLPRGPGGITPGGLHMPSDNATLAIGALGALGGLAVLSKMGSAARLKWLQSNYDRLDAKAKADVLNSLSPEERLMIGKNPEIAFGPEDVKSPSVRALVMDLGGTPPGTTSTGSSGSAYANDLFGGPGGRSSLPQNVTPKTPGLDASNPAEIRRLVAAGQMSPGDAAKINPNLLIDAYHATDTAGAQGILNEGFKAPVDEPGRLSYFSPNLQNAQANARIYGDNVLKGQIPASAFDPNFQGGLRAPASNLQGIPFRQLTPEELNVTRVINTPATGIPSQNPAARVTGADPASVAGRAAAGSDALRALGIATGPSPATIAGEAPRVSPIATDPWQWNRPPNAYGTFDTAPTAPTNPPATVAGDAGRSGIGRTALRGLGVAADVAGIPLMISQTGDVVNQRPAGALTGAMAVTAPTIIGAAALAAGSAAGVGALPATIGAGVLGAASTAFGPLSGQESNQTPGVIYGPDGRVISAGPTNPNIIPLGGGPGAQAARRGLTPTVPVNRQVVPTDVQRPLAPKPGDPGFTGPVDISRLGQGQGPPPGAEAEHRGVRPTPSGIGTAAGFTSPDSTATAAQSNDTRSPMDQFTSAFSSAASIAGDGFKIFGDVISDIGAAANMTDTLVRGFSNTEDIVGFIKQIQPFLQTGADVAKLVGDVGGIVAGAGGADPTGGAGAAGAGVQAISAIVGSAFDAVNQGITVGIEIYHQIGKYAAMMFAQTIGGDNTGPLGGNVRMLLNTKTNQLLSYGEENPLNKNTFNVPVWQRSYTQQPDTQQTLPPQVNIYTGPGQTPQGMMQESMWLVSTGGGSVASVAGAN